MLHAKYRAVIRAAQRRYAREHADDDTVYWFTPEGFLWYPRTLLGIEGHLYAF